MKLLKDQHSQIKVAGSSRSQNKDKQMCAVGDDEVILERTGHLQTSEKFDKVLELIGSKTVKDSFRFTKPGGIVCSTGELGNQWYLGAL